MTGRKGFIIHYARSLQRMTGPGLAAVTLLIATPAPAARSLSSAATTTSGSSSTAGS